MRLAGLVGGLLAVGCARGSYLPAELRLEGLSYGRSWRLYLVGEAGSAMEPTLRGLADSFAIDPELPSGLELDPNTGIIDGAPNAAVFPGVVHTVRALGADGFVETSLEIAALDGFLVDDVTDAADSTDDGVCDADGAPGCTLRAALAEVERGGERRAVYLPPGTYPLAVPSYFQQASVLGAAAADSIIDLAGGGLLALQGVPGDLADLTLRGAEVGALEAFGTTLRVSRVAFLDDLDDPSNGDAGGAFVDSGTSRFEFTTVRRCASWNGAGLRFQGGEHEVVASTFYDNRGYKPDNYTGALSIGGGSLRAVGCYFEGNHAVGPGPAIESEYRAELTIESCTFFANRSDSYHGGAVTIGMHAAGPAARLVNNTFVGNYNGAFLGVVHVGDGSIAVFANNVFRDNTNDEGPAPCTGNIVSLGGNIYDQSDPECHRGPLDIVADPGLEGGPGRDHGGPVPSIALRPGSPALDFGTSGACPATDGRGLLRPADGGDGRGGAPDGYPRCDAGAFEAQ